jgi:hypothetical protein
MNDPRIGGRSDPGDVRLRPLSAGAARSTMPMALGSIMLCIRRGASPEIE